MGKFSESSKENKNIIPVFSIRQTPPHFSHKRLGWLRENFGKDIDVRKADFGWPTNSPDLNPADFFLWGYLKERVYLEPVPKTIKQLKDNIRRKAKKLKIDMVKRAIYHMLPRGSKPSMQEGGLVRKIFKELDLFLL